MKNKLQSFLLVNSIQFIFILVVFISCSSSKHLSNQNLSGLYSFNENTPVVRYTVFHKNDSASELYYFVDVSSLLYVKPLNKDSFAANYKIKYELFKSYDSYQILDSSSIVKIDQEHFQQNLSLQDSLIVKAKFPGTYVLKTTFSDLNRNKDVETYIHINKKNHVNKQNFLVKNEDDIPLGKNYLSPENHIKICIKDSINGFLFVRYYKNNFPIALPPFVDYTSEPLVVHADSVFKIPLTNYQTDYFNLPKEGIYHFQLDSSKADGLTLFRFYNDFPMVASSDLMFQSLRYISSKKEYEKIYFLKDKKNGVDEFWIDIAGNTDRALTLIKKYYTRVEEANMFFSSFQEGWKTDRGMIYIIYGPPTLINRSDPIEAWTYGEPGTPATVTFKFSRFKNIFSDQDFRLNRSPLYKTGWYNALELWRR